MSRLTTVFQVQCGVQISSTENGEKTPMQTSNRYYVGVKVCKIKTKMKYI